MTFEKKIIPLRKEINLLDNEIISLLSKRLNVVEKVGILKKEFNIPALQEKR
jgi:chorismate mutase